MYATSNAWTEHERETLDDDDDITVKSILSGGDQLSTVMARHTGQRKLNDLQEYCQL